MNQAVPRVNPKLKTVPPLYLADVDRCRCSAGCVLGFKFALWLSILGAYFAFYDKVLAAL